MSRARVRALAWILVAAIGVAAIALWARGRNPDTLPPRVSAERPALMLLTSLPLLFGEDFSLAATGSPALTALEKRYRVVPISVADPAELAKGRLLLMAQPRAQPAEHLVALDAWVRAGGRVLLLADPALEWPSKRALGDPLAPPSAFADTGLLSHWGLRLDAPDARGPRTGRIGQQEVMTASPGTLIAATTACQVEPGGLVAHCRIGRGQAVIIADADFLNSEGAGALDGPTAANLDAMLAQLALLEPR